MTAPTLRDVAEALVAWAPDPERESEVRCAVCGCLGYHIDGCAVPMARLALSAPAPELGGYFHCPQCGPRVAADEDGCCAMCGADCRMVDEPAPAPSEDVAGLVAQLRAEAAQRGIRPTRAALLVAAANEIERIIPEIKQLKARQVVAKRLAEYVLARHNMTQEASVLAAMILVDDPTDPDALAAKLSETP